MNGWKKRMSAWKHKFNVLKNSHQNSTTRKWPEDHCWYWSTKERQSTNAKYRYFFNDMQTTMSSQLSEIKKSIQASFDEKIKRACHWIQSKIYATAITKNPDQPRSIARAAPPLQCAQQWASGIVPANYNVPSTVRSPDDWGPMDQQQVTANGPQQCVFVREHNWAGYCVPAIDESRRYRIESRPWTLSRLWFDVLSSEQTGTMQWMSSMVLQDCKARTKDNLLWSN